MLREAVRNTTCYVRPCTTHGGGSGGGQALTQGSSCIQAVMSLFEYEFWHFRVLNSMTIQGSLYSTHILTIEE